jgi:hypothetical protein
MLVTRIRVRGRDTVYPLTLIPHTRRCVNAKAPLCSPGYLSAFAIHVRAVTAGTHPGGDLFVAPEFPAPLGPPLNRQPSAADTAALLKANADNLALRQQLDAANADRTRERHGPAPNMILTAEMFERMFNRMAPASTPQESKEYVTPPKAKTGYAKVLLDVDASLKANEMPPVLKVSRANRARLQKETKAESTTRRVLIGNDGASLTIPGLDTGVTALTTDKDSQLWSGLSAFNRLFSIMAALPEEDFPRASLSEIMTVWAEVWDSPMGSHTQKLQAYIAFYDKYVGLLGTGVWLSKLDSDTRFLLEHMKGDNPAICNHCLGSGEGPSVITRADGGGGGGGGRKEERRAKETGKRKGPTGPCASMLIQSRTCDSTSCSRAHSPCACCGGACKSAKACVAWDQAAVTAKYGAMIERINASKRRSGGH